MTGRDLIMYILENHLENEPVFNDGKFIGFVSIQDVAVDMGVGSATVHAWICQGKLNCYAPDTVLIPADYKKKLEVTHV